MQIRTLLASATVLAFATASSAMAHEWYNGDCCSGQDCAPVDAIEHISPGVYEVTIFGYKLRTTKETWIRPSKEMSQRFHACMIFQSVQGAREQMPFIKCLYIPGVS